MTKSKSTSIKMYTKKNNETCYMFKLYCGIDPLTGKEQYTTRRGFKTRKEADLALAQLKIEISKGEYNKKQIETYRDIYNIWVVQYEKTVEESTFVKTIGIFRNHILPALGDYKIDKMTIDICQKHVDDWSMKLKKYRMVKSYASKVMDFAIKRSYIRNNPFRLVDMPKKLKKICMDEEEAENFYTKEQLLTFLICMEQESNFKAYVLFQLLAYSGMRKGEALALTWKDIDFIKNEVRINKAISRGKDNKLYVKTTKTGIARTIKIDLKTISILKAWKKQQQAEYLALGFNTIQPQLVFSNEVNEFLQPTKTRKWLEFILNKYQLPKITTHGFRHTHCSLLFEAGVSIKEVQDRLGHSDVQTTLNIYAHVSEKAKDEAISKLENFMTQ